jgi:hypothetical protein
VDQEKIPYVIYNGSGKEAQVLLIPRLEKQNSEWETVECKGGFCGVADPLGPTVSGEILLKEWYPTATAGTYRLSFAVYDGKGKEVRVSDTFELK